MGYKERIELYRRIEEIRKRPLLTFVTSSRPQASAQIASDVIPEFAKQILNIPKEKKEIDILIVSNGGDPTTSWRIVCMLRERFDKVGVLLPYAAFSAATLLALGADEIIMHPFSNLGPVDPQLTYIKKNPGDNNQQVINFGSEDLRNFLEFIRNDVGISDQEQLERVFELVCKDTGAIPIGVAKRSAQLALSMGEKLLSWHMKDGNKAKAIAETLNKSFYHHGYPVDRSEAHRIGLPIIKPPEDLEDVLWKVWKDVEEEMMCNHAFDPLEVVLNDPKTAALVGPVPQIQIPANAPPQIVQQAMATIMQQIAIVNIEPVDYTLFLATVESVYARSEFRSQLKISAVRLPDMRISVSVNRLSQGWKYYTN